VIAVVVLTHNRAHLLRQCIENVLQRASLATSEILIWDNASTDGTGELLDALDDPRIRVVRHPRNIGLSAYGAAFDRTSAEYVVQVDDDVIDAPPMWDRTLLDAFRRLPEVGFLAADLEDDPHDEAAYARYHVRPHLYTPFELHGVRLLEGPAGGGCAITTRDLIRRAGTFHRRRRKGVFFDVDAAYNDDIRRLGYREAVLADLRVHHAGGAYYSLPSAERQEFWDAYWRVQARKAAVKRVLLRLPLVRPLNDRYRLFEPPAYGQS
jgi:GT2 family glycosyltransferase